VLGYGPSTLNPLKPKREIFLKRKIKITLGKTSFTLRCKIKNKITSRI